MLDLLTDPNAWAALVTLSALEIVLGIDNVVFLSIVTNRLPAAQQPRAAHWQPPAVSEASAAPRRVARAQRPIESDRGSATRSRVPL